MKRLWLHSVRNYIRLGLFFYYRRIHVINQDQVYKDKPILFVSNHNNALLDALLIATKSGRFSYFLTRASVFKKPLINAFLRSLNMLPVYRIRDGWSHISENTAIFSSCSYCLANQEAVAIFPEGNHHINRTVRPLSKGFTRIVFETMERYPETNLQLIPIGINYEQADAFADSVSIYFGTSLAAKDFMSGDRKEQTNTLKRSVSESIKKLTTHIPARNYNQDLSRLKAHEANFLHPLAVNSCLNSNFKNCTFKNAKKPQVLKAGFKFLMILLLCVPYGIWKLFAEPKVQEVEFVSTFRFGIAISLVPLWLILIAVLLTLTFGVSYACLYVASSLLVTVLAVKL